MTRSTACLFVVCATLLQAQNPAQTPAQTPAPPAAAPAPEDPVRTLVGRLDLEQYKATIKGLTQFGDRQHRVFRDVEDGGRLAGAGLTFRRERSLRHRLSRRGGQPHAEHRLGSVR